MLQQVVQVKTVQRQRPTMVSRKKVATLISSLSYPGRCKGLTDFETYSVIPLGLEHSEVRICKSTNYAFKYSAGDKPVNSSHFGSIWPVVRTVSKIKEIL